MSTDHYSLIASESQECDTGLKHERLLIKTRYAHMSFTLSLSGTFTTTGIKIFSNFIAPSNTAKAVYSIGPRMVLARMAIRMKKKRSMFNLRSRLSDTLELNDLQ